MYYLTTFPGFHAAESSLPQFCYIFKYKSLSMRIVLFKHAISHFKNCIILSHGIQARIYESCSFQSVLCEPSDGRTPHLAP